MRVKPARTALASLITLIISLSGCDNKSAATPSVPPQPVTVVTLRTESVNLSSVLPGRTTAYRVAEVRPQVDGIIIKRLFTEGAEIKAGQQLYQIDPAVYEAALDNAQANTEQYRSLANRYHQLVDEQAVSRQE